MSDKTPRRGSRLFEPDPKSEVQEELAFHIEERVRAGVARGLDPEAARSAALQRFGDVRAVHRECADLLSAERREERRRDRFGDLVQDARFGVRNAVRTPLFTVLAVVTLALGIGANAAVFGVVKSVLLDSLPYADAGRLVRIYTEWDSSPGERSSVSPGAALDLAERLRTFEGVDWFNFSTFDVVHLDAGDARLLPAAQVSSGFFNTLGVQPAAGRTFDESDVGTPVIVLSHGAWQREFGGDAGAVGQSMHVANLTREIVGILPRGFVGPMGEADVWFPLNLAPSLADPVSGRGQHWLGVVGRLAPGVSRQAAQLEVDRVAADLAREYPDTDRGRTFRTVALRDDLVGETRTPLLVLMASAGLVLLITCANLAGALLSRTVGRRKELAVRVALGAGRGRLVRQLLTESAVIAVAGAAAGLVLAGMGLAALDGFAAGALPPYATVGLDGGVVLVTVLAALLTGVAFGTAPALAAGGWQPQGMLREEGRGTSEGRRSRRLRGALVAGQIALSVSLLAGAGLLVRSLLAMNAAPLGFDPNGVLVARVDLPQSGYPTPEERTLFFQEFESRLAALPGVQDVASTSQIPSRVMSSNALTVEGFVMPGDGSIFIPYMNVSDDYFRTAGTDLVEGRTFGPEDNAGVPPVIIVSETMARRYWPDGNAVGRRLRVSPHTADEWGTVIGIVRDVRPDPAQQAAEPMAYATYRQDMGWGGRDFLVRTHGNPVALIGAVRSELAAMDATVPLRHPRPLRAVMDERIAGRRLPVLLMTMFGALALLLACVGIYAMFANMATAREREFGVRMALGSSRSAIAGLVIRQGAAWMAVGLAGGMVGVLVVGQMLRDLLYNVKPLDPVTLAVAVAVLLVCATVALLVPVRRATRSDPVRVLQ